MWIERRTNAFVVFCDIFFSLASVSIPSQNINMNVRTISFGALCHFKMRRWLNWSVNFVADEREFKLRDSFHFELKIVWPRKYEIADNNKIKTELEKSIITTQLIYRVQWQFIVRLKQREFTAEFDEKMHFPNCNCYSNWKWPMRSVLQRHRKKRTIDSPAVNKQLPLSFENCFWICKKKKWTKKATETSVRWNFIFPFGWVFCVVSRAFNDKKILDFSWFYSQFLTLFARPCSFTFLFLSFSLVAIQFLSLDFRSLFSLLKSIDIVEQTAHRISTTSRDNSVNINTISVNM